MAAGKDLSDKAGAKPSFNFGPDRAEAPIALQKELLEANEQTS